MSTPMQIDNINRVFAILDVNGNGKISWSDLENVVKAEFDKAQVSQVLSVGTLLDKWVVTADRGFDLIDQDGDGRVDEDELASLYRGAGITDRQVARVAFQAMDLNEDNRVDKTEWLAHVRGLFLAVDESMKGAHLISGS